MSVRLVVNLLNWFAIRIRMQTASCAFVNTVFETITITVLGNIVIKRESSLLKDLSFDGKRLITWRSRS